MLPLTTICHLILNMLCYHLPLIHVINPYEFILILRMTPQHNYEYAIMVNIMGIMPLWHIHNYA